MGSTETNQVKDAFITALEKRNPPAVAERCLPSRPCRETSLSYPPTTTRCRRWGELGDGSAKEFITVKEAHVLLGCSDGHIRNLVDKARKGRTSYPIPFLDLDGVTIFPLAKLLEWAERPKLRKRAAS